MYAHAHTLRASSEIDKNLSVKKITTTVPLLK